MWQGMWDFISQIMGLISHPAVEVWRKADTKNIDYEGKESVTAESIDGIFFFISWRLITLQYCSGFCHTLMNQPWIYMCSTSRSPLPPPSPPDPSRSSQCTRSEHLSHAYNLGW